MEDGPEEQMPVDVVAFRFYVNTAKRVLLEGLETAHPTDPNITHDLVRLDMAFSKLVRFGNALSDYFKGVGSIEMVARNHEAIFRDDEIPDGFDLMELKRDPAKRNACIYIIDNDIKRNTYSYRK